MERFKWHERAPTLTPLKTFRMNWNANCVPGLLAPTSATNLPNTRVGEWTQIPRAMLQKSSATFRIGCISTYTCHGQASTYVWPYSASLMSSSTNKHTGHLRLVKIIPCNSLVYFLQSILILVVSIV